MTARTVDEQGAVVVRHALLIDRHFVAGADPFDARWAPALIGIRLPVCVNIGSSCPGLPEAWSWSTKQNDRSSQLLPAVVRFFPCRPRLGSASLGTQFDKR